MQILCAHCGFTNLEEMNFCGRCGAQLPRPCPVCGFTNPTDHVFCGKCGARLSTPPVSAGAAPDAGAHATGAAGHPGAPSPRARHTPEAERRQLTVLFCDLVESTALAGQLDPEDYRELVRAYQDACATVIQRFDGHIAQYLGDGLLVYFGYPQAHEDDAQRAVRAGLALVAAMAPLKSRLGHDTGIRLAVRVGIHTGLVVVGRWAVGDGTSAWLSGTRRIWRHDCKGWRNPIRW